MLIMRTKNGTLPSAHSCNRSRTRLVQSASASVHKRVRVSTHAFNYCRILLSAKRQRTTDLNFENLIVMKVNVECISGFTGVLKAVSAKI